MHTSPVIISIGGPQRSGKTTLAAGIAQTLEQHGNNPVSICIDETRVGIFGPDGKMGGDPNLPDTNHWRQKRAYNAMFHIRIPDILNAGGTPLVVATHSRRSDYTRLQKQAKEHNAELIFILIEQTDDDEFIKRCKEDTDSSSDMNDPENHPEQMAAYRDTCQRLYDSYNNPDDPFTGDILRIAQSTPQDMQKRALTYIRERMS